MPMLRNKLPASAAKAAISAAHVKARTNPFSERAVVEFDAVMLLATTVSFFESQLDQTYKAAGFFAPGNS
jgi:hypothetical protein